MKAIRYLAGCLLFVTGVLHFLPIIITPSDPKSIGMLVGGIIYLTIGVLLIKKIRFASLLGLFFPLLGLVIGFIATGFKNCDPLLIFMWVIDAIVVICCLLLLLNRKKE
ncbi:MAG TPA: hypothetical protein VMV77_19300 [Bacteroidales bacterium]|nr:hypothetical protein [Bacteroidales bacterium]